MTMIAAEAAGGAGEGAGLGAIGGAGLGGFGGQDRPGGSSTTFAIAVLLLGMACIGLWIAFHKPENAETGGFPGLFGQMLQWVHAGETSSGAASTPGGTAPSPSELQQIKNLPSSFWDDLKKIAGGGGPLGQWGEWFLHLPI